MAKKYQEEGSIHPCKWLFSTQEFVRYPQGYINSSDFRESTYRVEKHGDIKTTVTRRPLTNEEKAKKLDEVGVTPEAIRDKTYKREPIKTRVNISKPKSGRKLNLPSLEYDQIDVCYCPISNCKGMLLVSPYVHERKCSDCSRYFLEVTKWVEVTK